jgi:hypothetical protein
MSFVESKRNGFGLWEGALNAQGVLHFGARPLSVGFRHRVPGCGHVLVFTQRSTRCRLEKCRDHPAWMECWQSLGSLRFELEWTRLPRIRGRQYVSRASPLRTSRPRIRSVEDEGVWRARLLRSICFPRPLPGRHRDDALVLPTTRTQVFPESIMRFLVPEVLSTPRMRPAQLNIHIHQTEPFRIVENSCTTTSMVFRWSSESK